MPSSPATLRVLLIELAHNLENRDFRPTWPCLIIEFLATYVKFLKPAGYLITINFIFRTTNIFVAF